jgi:hypothetical protein
MNSSLPVDSNNSLSTLDSRLQPPLSDIYSESQGFFTTPSAPVQLAQIYNLTDLKAQQALIKAKSSKQLEFPSIDVFSDDEAEIFPNIVNDNILSPFEKKNDWDLITGALVEDNTLGTARNLGNLTGTKTFSDFVETTDPIDYYRFSLNGNSNLKLTLNNMTANADLQLLNSSGGVINAFKSISSSEKAIFATLSEGTYYTRIYPVGRVNANYKLSLNAIADSAGNTLRTARNIGNPSGNLSDFVGSTDTNDYYRFTLNNNSNFRLGMNGMSANADVQLLNSSGGVITTSTATGSNSESMVRTLNAGTYYVRAYPVGNANTNYNLSLNATLINPLIPADNAGNTLATARNIGNLAGIRKFTDWVGSQDKNDYYRFTLNDESDFSIVLNGMTANADIQLLNSSGGVIESSTTAGPTEEAIFGDLNRGTYYVRIYPVGTASTNYNLNFIAFADDFGEV